MKLNPKKCIYRVRGGKFLGLVINYRGIEANARIRGVLDKQPPRSIKEVQWLTECTVALGCLMSRPTDRCHPFFRVLIKHDNFERTLDTHRAFQELKKYLSRLAKIASSSRGQPLLMSKVVFTGG